MPSRPWTLALASVVASLAAATSAWLVFAPLARGPFLIDDLPAIVLNRDVAAKAGLGGGSGDGGDGLRNIWTRHDFWGQELTSPLRWVEAGKTGVGEWRRIGMAIVDDAATSRTARSRRLAFDGSIFGKAIAPAHSALSISRYTRRTAFCSSGCWFACCRAQVMCDGGEEEVVVSESGARWCNALCVPPFIYIYLRNK